MAPAGTLEVTSIKGERPSISRALTQDATSSGKLPGRRRGRDLGQKRRKHVTRTRIIEDDRGAENESRGHKREFELFQIEVRISFFLRSFAFSNVLAKFAGMLAIKGFGQSFREWSTLGIADHHLGPGQ